MGLFNVFKKKDKKVKEQTKPKFNFSGLKSPKEFEAAHENASSYDEGDQAILAYIDFLFKDKKEYVAEQTLDICIREFGFEFNPFIEYTKQLIKLNIKLSEDKFTMVYNAYVKKYIDNHDLCGKGEDKLNHLIFNKNLFSQLADDDNDDFDYYLATYHKLTNFIFREELCTKKVNIGGKIYDIKKNFNGLADIKDVIRLRDTIIYVNGKPNSQLRSVHDVKGILLDVK